MRAMFVCFLVGFVLLEVSYHSDAFVSVLGYSGAGFAGDVFRFLSGCCLAVGVVVGVLEGVRVPRG